jgi:hypothetical protein
VAILLGEKADEEPSAALVRACDEPVDRLVFTGDVPVRFLTADGSLVFGVVFGNGGGG